MLGAQRGICKIITMPSKPKSRMPMHKCLWQLEWKKEVNHAFFYDFMVDEQRWLVCVFWADALCRKNYSVFGDVIFVDTTYSTNQYNMKFAPFTWVNRHLQSVFLGAALIGDEKYQVICTSV
jgi:endo-beta-N-acetylglucosaminidase D